MRFQAVMLPSKREFVISYFLEDDTIGIFETLVRNSGFPSGIGPNVRWTKLLTLYCREIHGAA